MAPAVGRQELLTRQQINSHISAIFTAKKDFRWAQVTDQVLWSALKYSNNSLTIGYKPSTWSNERVASELHTIDVNSPEWQTAKKEVLRLVEDVEGHLGWDENKLKLDQQSSLPVLNLQVYNLSTIGYLRKSALVRYLEPIGYDFSSEQESVQLQGFFSNLLGCNRANPYAGTLVEGRDYTYIDYVKNYGSTACNSAQYAQGCVPAAPYLIRTGGCIVSWNYAAHKIPEAWAISSGADITVMVIDTGCSSSQENLSVDFNQGMSVGRTVEHLSTLSDYPALEDQCGHGTMMAGIIAGPRGVDGAACGVAYNCNLVTVRAAHDVFISGRKEIMAVVKAFELATSRDDIKIISMSMGCMLYDSQIADAIKKASNAGKLIFCAAGTTLDHLTVTKYWGVVFPASMPEVLAVTGIEDNLKVACDVCHDGMEVDFVTVMQKQDSNLRSLMLASSGDIPAEDGGSSAATAMMAGMAAIVWSKYPNNSAAEILKILRASSRAPRRLSYNSSSGISAINEIEWDLEQVRRYQQIFGVSAYSIWGSGLLDVYKAVTR